MTVSVDAVTNVMLDKRKCPLDVLDGMFCMNKVSGQTMLILGYWVIKSFSSVIHGGEISETNQVFWHNIRINTNTVHAQDVKNKVLITIVVKIGICKR